MKGASRVSYRRSMWGCRPSPNIAHTSSKGSSLCQQSTTKLDCIRIDYSIPSDPHSTSNQHKTHGLPWTCREIASLRWRSMKGDAGEAVAQHPPDGDGLHLQQRALGGVAVHGCD